MKLQVTYLSNYLSQRKAEMFECVRILVLSHNLNCAFIITVRSPFKFLTLLKCLYSVYACLIWECHVNSCSENPFCALRFQFLWSGFLYSTVCIGMIRSCSPEVWTKYLALLKFASRMRPSDWMITRLKNVRGLRWRLVSRLQST